MVADKFLSVHQLSFLLGKKIFLTWRVRGTLKIGFYRTEKILCLGLSTFLSMYFLEFIVTYLLAG